MRARDLMIPLWEYLQPDNTIKEAVNLLRTAKRGEEKVGVKGLPVLDANRQLVGMLSMGDILKAVYPSYMLMMDLGDFTWHGMVDSIAKQVADKRVGTVMTKDVVTIRENDPLMQCIDHMIRNDVKRLPVLDQSGVVVGMLYERDVFFAIVKAMLDDNSEAAK